MAVPVPNPNTIYPTGLWHDMKELLIMLDKGHHYRKDNRQAPDDKQYRQRCVIQDK